MQMPKDKWYELLYELEIETTKSRLRNFTAFLSISFILPGLATNVGTDPPCQPITIGEFTLSLSQAVFSLGFLFYCFASYYYWWHHRFAHLYRDKLKELEKDLEIDIYRLRKRPTWPNRDPPSQRRIKFSFHWALYIIGIFYFLITASYVGWLPLGLGIGIISIVYTFLILSSNLQKDEPTESASTDTLTTEQS